MALVVGYDAFLSYSHGADSALAPAVQRGLQRLAKPWNRPRALRVFRDQASLAANPDLWTTIEAALENSRFFVLLASPKSARSPWVGREISFWKRHRSPDRMLIVLTDGEIVWDHRRGDFDWERTTALPADLRGWFQGEPLWVDLRWAAAESALSLDHGRFREAVGMLAAAVHGVSKDELDSEDARQHARTVRLRRAGVSALTVLLVIALVLANLADQRRKEAEDQRRQAEEQRRLATVRALQAEAENLRETDPLTSLRFSMAALRIKPTAETREGLVTTLQRTRLAGSSASGVGKSDLASYAADGTLLVTAAPFVGRTAAARHTVALWDTRGVRPRRLATLTGHGEDVQDLAVRADGRLLVSIGNAGRDGQYRSSLILWDLTNRNRPRRMLHWTGLHDARAAALSPDGRTMAVVAGRANGTVQLWDVTKPSAPRRLTGPLHAADSDQVAFSPDGRTLVTGSGWFFGTDESLDPKSVTHDTGWQVWDISDARHPHALERLGPFGTFAVFSPAAPVLAVNTDRTLTLWDLRRPRTPRQLARLDHKEQVRAAAFSPDGRYLTVSSDHTVLLRDVSDPARPGKPVMLGEHDKTVSAIAFSRDQRTVSLTDESGAVTRWLVGSRAPARAAVLSMNGASPTASAFGADGRELAVADMSGRVWLWDTTDPARPRRRALLTGLRQRAAVVSFDGDGSVLAVGSQAGLEDQSGEITLWDTTDLSAPRHLTTIPTRTGVSALTLSPRRRGLVATGAESFGPRSWVCLWDVRDPRHPVRTWRMDPYDPRAPETTSAGPGALPRPPSWSDTPAVFGPDGTTLALPDTLWNSTNASAPTRLPVRRTPGPETILEEGFDLAAFSADGHELVTSDRDGLAVWSVDPRKGRRLLSSASVSDRLTQIDVHPEGHLVASGNGVGQAVLWVVGGSGPPTRAATLTNAMADVADVRFSGDRKTLAVTLDTGTVELWDLGGLPAIAADPTAVACALTGTGLSRGDWQRYAPGLPYEPTCPRG